MKKFIVIAAVLVISSGLCAQALSEEDLVGDWTVVRIHEVSDEIPPGMKQEIEMMRNAFLTSKFHFELNKNFTYDFSLFNDEMRIAGEHWKLDSRTGNVIIQEWKDKDKEKPVLMGIKVLKQDGKTIFIVQEAFFALEVKRED